MFTWEKFIFTFLKLPTCKKKKTTQCVEKAWSYSKRVGSQNCKGTSCKAKMWGILEAAVLKTGLTGSPLSVVVLVRKVDSTMPLCWGLLLSSGSVGKESAFGASEPGLIPGLGRWLGEGNGNPLRYTCLSSLDRGAWQAIVHGVPRVGHDFATKPPPRFA